MNNINSNTRIAWIDNAKYFAMICVIIYHCGSFSDSIFLGQLIESFNMPLFMFLSGYCSYKSLNKLEGFNMFYPFFRRKFLQIMIPCLFMSFLTIPWTMDYLFFLHKYWFLHCLFSIIIVYAIFIIISNKIYPQKYFFIGTIITLLILLFIDRNNISEMTPYFIVGIIIRKYNILTMLFCKNNTTKHLITGGGIFIWLVLYKLYYVSFYSANFHFLLLKGELILYVFRHISALFAIVSILIIIYSLSKKYNILSSFGSKTLGMYLVHVFIVDNFIDYYDFNVNGYSLDMKYFYTFIGSVALISVTMIICWICSQYRILRLLILGQLK